MDGARGTIGVRLLRRDLDLGEQREAADHRRDGLELGRRDGIVHEGEEQAADGAGVRAAFLGEAGPRAEVPQLSDPAVRPHHGREPLAVPERLVLGRLLPSGGRCRHLLEGGSSSSSSIGASLPDQHPLLGQQRPSPRAGARRARAQRLLFRGQEVPLADRQDPAALDAAGDVLAPGPRDARARDGVGGREQREHPAPPHVVREHVRGRIHRPAALVEQVHVGVRTQPLEVPGRGLGRGARGVGCDAGLLGLPARQLERRGARVDGRRRGGGGLLLFLIGGWGGVGCGD